MKFFFFSPRLVITCFPDSSFISLRKDLNFPLAGCPSEEKKEFLPSGSHSWEKARCLEYWCLDQIHGFPNHLLAKPCKLCRDLFPKPQVDSKQKIELRNHFWLKGRCWSSTKFQFFISMASDWAGVNSRPPRKLRIQIRWFLGKSLWEVGITSTVDKLVFPFRGTDCGLQALIWVASLRFHF